MSRFWCIWEPLSRNIATYRGYPIVHNDKAELEFIFPYNRIIELPSGFTEVLRLQDHPRFHGVRFPLDVNQRRFPH